MSRDIEEIRNNQTKKFTESFDGFIYGVFYSLSFLFFLDGSKPSLETLIVAAGGALLLSVGYMLLESFLTTMGFYDTQDGFYGKYKDVIIPIVVHFIMGYFIYSVIR